MTSSEKRERHKTGHRSRMEEARIAAAKARRRNRIVRILIGVLVVGVAAAALVILAQDDPPEPVPADARAPRAALSRSDAVAGT